MQPQVGIPHKVHTREKIGAQMRFLDTFGTDLDHFRKFHDNLKFSIFRVSGRARMGIEPAAWQALRLGLTEYRVPRCAVEVKREAFGAQMRFLATFGTDLDHFRKFHDHLKFSIF